MSTALTSFKPKQLVFLNAVRAEYPGATTIDREQVRTICDKYSLGWPAWLTGNMAYRAGRGLFVVPNTSGAQMSPATPTPRNAAPNAGPTFTERPAFQPPVPVAPEQTQTSQPEASWSLQGANASMVPDRLATFVPFGIYRDLKAIVASGMFYPVFITGLSGNGKTETAAQVCAENNREMFLVSITCETDEDDLLGGFRLQDGNTVWQDGPVVAAMKRGAVLVLDELDYASHKIACLQSVLTGKGVFLKKIGQWVTPKPGFQVIATANTKGKGDENGRFVGTNVLNEAFLDRFPVTLEQDYPPAKVERKIITGIMSGQGVTDPEFVDRLVVWSENVRKAFAEGAVDEVVTTRRLIHIVTAYSIFRDRLKAIEVAITRFDEATKTAFLDLYKAIDAQASAPAPTEPAAAAAEVKEEIPF